MRVTVSSKLLHSLFQLVMLLEDLAEDEKRAHLEVVQTASKTAVNRSMAAHSGPDDYFWNVVRMAIGGEIPQLEAKALGRTTFASLEKQLVRLQGVTPHFPLSDPMDYVDELFVEKNREPLVAWILAGEERSPYRGALALCAADAYGETPDLARVAAENPWPEE